jgi:hypothetical protein
MTDKRWAPGGFWFGGRYWPPIAGGAEEAEAEPATTGGEDAAAGRLAELQARITTLESAAQDAAAALEVERREHGEAQLRGLDHYRRALIAEHGATAVHELIQGSTEELLEASVEVARAAFARIQGQLPTGAAATVPAGAGARTGQDVDGLSPVAKIARGLAK